MSEKAARSIGTVCSELVELLKKMTEPVVLKLVKCPKATAADIAKHYGLAARPSIVMQAIGDGFHDRRSEVPL